MLQQQHSIGNIEFFDNSCLTPERLILMLSNRRSEKLGFKMLKAATLVSVLIFSSLILSACRTDSHTVMGLTDAKIATTQTTVAK